MAGCTTCLEAEAVHDCGEDGLLCTRCFKQGIFDLLLDDVNAGLLQIDADGMVRTARRDG